MKEREKLPSPVSYEKPLDGLLEKPVASARLEPEVREDRASFRKRLFAMLTRATLEELSDFGIELPIPQWMIELDRREYIAFCGGTIADYPGYQKWMSPQDFEHKMTVPGPNGTRVRPTHKQWITDDDIKDGY